MQVTGRLPQHDGRDVVLKQRRAGAGFSLFEFAVVVFIFAILLVVLLNRMAFYQDRSQHAGAELLLANLRSALSMRVVALRAQGREADVRALAGQNPIDWLQTAPANYAGALDSQSAKQVQADNWYFDKASKNLVYVYQGQKNLPSDVLERNYFKVESHGLPTQTAKPTGASSSNAEAVLIQVDGPDGRRTTGSLFR